MPTTEAQLLLTVEAGETPLRSMRFFPGRPVPPVTIGLTGSWRVAAESVKPVHVTITYDGQQLYVASAHTDAATFLNGAPIDERWWLLNPPAELRLGGARIRLALVEGTVSPSPIGSATVLADAPVGPAFGARTSLDAGGQWLERHKSQNPPAFGQQTRFGPAPPSVDQGRVPLRQQPTPTPEVHQRNAGAVHSAAPPARLPSLLVSPMGATPAPARETAPPDVGSGPNTVPKPGGSAPPTSPNRPPLASAGQAAVIIERAPMASTIVRPQGWQPGQPSPSAGSDPSQAAMASTVPGRQGYTPAASPDLSVAVPPPGEVQAPWPSQPPYPELPSEPHHVPPHGPGGAPWWVDPAPQGPATSDTPPTVSSTSLSRRLFENWRAISLPKKITALLVPTAFLLLLLPPPGEDPTQPAVHAVATSAPTRTAGRDSESAPRGARSATPPAERPHQDEPPGARAAQKAAGDVVNPSASTTANAVRSPASAPSAASTREPPDPLERAALDAAFEGRWQDAHKTYEQLAASHPDQPAFREAARVIRENKLGQR